MPSLPLPKPPPLVLAALLLYLCALAAAQPTAGVPAGLNFEPCRADGECAAPRRCVFAAPFDDGAALPCPTPIAGAGGGGGDTPACFCFSFAPRARGCAASAACAYGERCMSRGAAEGGARDCVSCAVAANTTVSSAADGSSSSSSGSGGDNSGSLRPAFVDGGNCPVPGSAAPTPSPSPPPRAPASRLNFEGCDARAQCAPPRSCLDAAALADGFEQDCAPDAVFCYCLRRAADADADADSNQQQEQGQEGQSGAPQAPGCASSRSCDVGERCVVAPPPFRGADCVACAVVRPGAALVDTGRCAAGDEPAPLPTPSASPSPTRTGPQSPPSGSGGDEDPEQSDDTDNDDEDDDVTASPSPSPSPPAPAPCIAARHLAHMHPAELVFARHRRAGVLCDAGGSCATAGHMVAFHGAPMSMGAYCARHAACTDALDVAVNSPRLRRGARVRVRAPTPGLEFTALAARYGSRAEEWILRALVRLGW